MRPPVFIRNLAVILGVITLALLSACHGGQAQGDAASPPPEVTVVTLKSQPVMLTHELPGRTRAFLVAEIRPQVNGIIKKRLFTEGGFVKAGQPLYDLDDAIYRAQYESAHGALRKAQATLHAAELSANRSRELVGIKAISTQDNENAVASEAQAQADLAVAQAAVDTARVNLEYAHIVAPISGFIGKSNVTQGALVTADQADTLATIQQLDPMYVEVNQSSSDWLTLKQTMGANGARSDAAVKILLENGTSYDTDGQLQFTDVTVDPTTGNFLLRVVVPNPKQLLLPGMYVRAVVSEGTVPKAVLVPQQGVTHDAQGNATALVVGKDNKVESRTLHVLRTIGDQWVVQDGLAAGDRVVVVGLQNIQPGIAVHAVEQGAVEQAATGTGH